VHNALRPTRRGFTLVETIAVILVISIAFPPLMWSIRQAHLARVAPARFSIARWLAAEKLEDIIADRNSATRGYSYLTAAHYPAEATINGFTGFSRTVSLSETGADLTTSGAGYMKVTVTVSFQDGAGTTRSYPLSVIVTNY
jgi:prepilin-type N-terminal cleavage/methylation domain-containing protein